VKILKLLAFWAISSASIGAAAGTASALFLWALKVCGALRDANTWLLALLPVAGFGIGAAYHYLGGASAGGNNLVLDSYWSRKTRLPYIMAPLVLAGTLVSHLFGASVGREGTAVQMGASFANHISRLMKLGFSDTRAFTVMGISAGFASVFGTPLAGAVFAVEVLAIGRISYRYLLPSLFAALAGDFVCTAWGAGHIHYSAGIVPQLSPIAIALTGIAGVCFGLAAMLFSKSSHWLSALFAHYIKYPPLRPLAGGCIIAASVPLLGTYGYIGLGLAGIDSAFESSASWMHWIGKLAYTTLSLGSGFKGGEVTPLFFIGSNLGSSLASVIPLPVALLAGMGFVGVFSGATNTPLACTLMGIELFGAEAGVFMAVTCFVAYIASRHSGIYMAQKIGEPKIRLWMRDKDKCLSNL
jgi:H+/Cl- antiporter ClcA